MRRRQPAYQIDVGAPQPYRAFVTDLAAGGSSMDISGNAAATYALPGRCWPWRWRRRRRNFAADAVVNAATFTSGIAPGGIMAIFGTGLSGAGTAPGGGYGWHGGGRAVASAFQINAQVPPGTAPGVHTLRVKSAYGAAQQHRGVGGGAGDLPDGQRPAEGAVLNQDSS